MKKIGLVISRALNGFEVLRASEAAEGHKVNISDPRRIISSISGLTTGNNITCITFESNVAFVHYIEMIGGRGGGDFKMATITVPSDVKVSGTELAKLLGELKGFSDSDASVLEKVSKEYDTKQVADICKPSPIDGVIAFRKYGKGTDYSLAEILDGLFQDYYSDCKTVVLLDSASGLEVNCDTKDLTDRPIRKRALLKYPQVAKKNGIALTVNGKPFDSDLLLWQYDKVNVQCSKSIYVPITLPITLSKEVNEVPMDNIGWKVVLKRNMFDIRDSKTNKQLDNADVTVEGQLVNGKDNFSVTSLENAMVDVKCYSYDHHSGQMRIDLHSTNRIQLSMKPRTLNYTIESQTVCSNLKITVDDPSWDEKLSPISGYYVDGNRSGSIQLRKEKPKKSWIGTILICICTFLFGVIVAGTGCFLYEDYFKKSLTGENLIPTQDKQKKESNVTEDVNKGVKKDTTAIATDYIKKNPNSWDKANMEKIGLSKLWEDVANFYVDNIKEWDKKFNGKLSDVKAWKKVMQAATSSKYLPNDSKLKNNEQIDFDNYQSGLKHKSKPAAQQNAKLAPSGSSRRLGENDE